MPSRYPPEFRRKVLDLIAAGRSVAEVVSARSLARTSDLVELWMALRALGVIDTPDGPV